MDARRFKKPAALFLFAVLGVVIFAIAVMAGRHMTKSGGAPSALVIDEALLDDFLGQFNQAGSPQEKIYFPENNFTGPDGRPMTLSVGKGDYALVNLWATWCAPCVVELPSLNILSENMDSEFGVRILAISIDKTRNLDRLREFLHSRDIGDFALHHDESGQIRGGLPLRGIPTSFLIGEGNEILYILEGDIDWMSPPSRAFFDFLSLKRS